MSVSEDQNLPENIKLRRAIAQAYFYAKCSMGGQFAVTVVLPVALSIAAILMPDVRPYAAIASLLALGLDVFWLDRRQKTTLQTAAKLLERFDCNVLRMTWNKTIAGAGISNKEITELDSAYRERGKKDDRLIDWYPVEASRAPAHQARIICQLTNAQYDGRLRWRYRAALVVILIGVVSGLMALGLMANLSFLAFVVSIAVPATPVAGWALREFYRQLDTDKPLERIQEEALELWADARAHPDEAERISQLSRTLQDAIFIYRSRAPLPLPFVYALVRGRLEVKMARSAADRLSEIEL